MRLYKRIVFNEYNEGSDLPGDRGDAVLEEEVPVQAESEPEQVEETEEEQVRDEQGRFAKKDEPRIPKARFDEAVAKERERVAVLEKQLAAMQSMQSQVDRKASAAQIDAEINELEKQRTAMLLEGEGDKASELAAMIRARERQLYIEESRTMGAQAKEQAREEIRIDLTVERLETEYPALNPDSSDYDEILTEAVKSTQRLLMQTKGMSPSKALAEAAVTVMTRFGNSGPTDTKKGLATSVDDRKSAQVKKNLETSRKQPASLKDSGMDSDKMGDRAIDIASMSYEEFEALPESTKAKMRGDFA
jgi:hypothetical protein